MMRMRTFSGLIVAGLAALSLSAASLGQELNGRVETLLDGAKLGRARVGISIIDVETGRVLADHDAAGAYIPASNMKLLTTGTALMVLGPEFVFRTELRRAGDRLVVRGAGDPAFADPDLLDQMEPKRTVGDVLDALAQAVAKDGAAPLREIVIDDRVFDRQAVHPGWPADQLNQWYCAEVSGLNFHANVLGVFPQPAAEGPGHLPRMLTQPEAGWLEFEIKARTVNQGRNTVWLLRDPTDNRFTAFGEVRFPSQSPVMVSLTDNGAFFGRLLAERLALAGVRIEDEGRTAGHAVRLAAADEVLDGGKVLAIVTTPMEVVLNRCNTDSHNLYAESLIKRVGHEVTGEPGSWTNGGSVVRMTLAEVLGPAEAATTVVSDGSGLSRENRVAPATVTKWLGAMSRSEKAGEAFMHSLATPGRGTLRARLKDAGLRNELRAKSGYINGVRCLSGYLTSPTTGRRVAFSILINDIPAGEASGLSKKFQDDVVLAIDRWLAAKAAAEAPAVGG